MTGELKSMEVTGLPDVEHLAEDVARTGVPYVLQRNGEDLAVVSPATAPATPTSRPRSSEATSPNAWLERLIGIGAAAGGNDVSGNIHRHIAEATRREPDDSTNA